MKLICLYFNKKDENIDENLFEVTVFFRINTVVFLEWIQNSDIRKQRLLQNSYNYKTATTTKQRQLQNSDCYKTAVM